jgi:hypothetical protein
LIPLSAIQCEHHWWPYRRSKITLHPSPEIAHHRHCTNSRCNPSMHIGKRLYPFTVHNTFDTPPEE